MQLTDKTILLTGATGGIGIELANALAKEGSTLILTGRNQTKLDSLAADLGDKHTTVPADLATQQGRQQLLDVATKNSVDLLINLAGINQMSLLEQMQDDELDLLVTSNFLVPMQLCKDMIPLLSDKASSAIVNIGSILGSIGFAGSTVYCATKFGLRGFTEALRRELYDTNIDVVYIAPRVTNTNMNDEKTQQMNKSLGNASDDPSLVAKLIVDTLKQNNPHSIYIGWPEKFVVCLNGLFPKLVDGSLNKKLSIIKQYIE